MVGAFGRASSRRSAREIGAFATWTSISLARLEIGSRGAPFGSLEG
jgi:hypothetical protein